MTDFEEIRSLYLRYPDRSDFAPMAEDDAVTILYDGDAGLVKARHLAFIAGIDASFAAAEKSKILEVLEGLDDAGEDEYESEEDDDLDVSVDDILSASYDDAPIIKLVNQVIIHAVKAGASDIHFEGRPNRFLVRMRIDGKLTTARTYPKDLQEPIMARIKVVAALDVAESRRAQDGRINLRIGNRTVDIRVSTVPSVVGEKAVLRILERSKQIMGLDTSGMNAKQLKLFRQFLSRTSGIILVTGPTGSGKSTTLYGSLMEMNRDDKNVLTIEDPVEYHIDNITQVQVNPAVNITFATALRAFLRQDPDIILVGEVRDTETASAAVQASLTGHLVLSTLHTNDAPSAVARLVEMDVEPFLLSTSLLVVVGQRLVRRVCEHCAAEVEATDELKEFFGERGLTLSTYRQGKGCDVCLDSGYKGRVGIFEVLPITDDIRRLINNRAAAFEIRDAAKKTGFSDMFDHGWELIEKGITTPEELLAVIRTE